MPSPYPVVLESILMPKVWGGRRLGSMGKRLPDDGSDIGESWELADLAGTSPSGGGGGPARTTIADGPMRGQTIHDAIRAWGADLLGRARQTDQGAFPLLVKYLDAREHLSVQVHPSAAYAAAHPQAHLKTESWYIVAAEPGAELFIGLKPGVSRDDLARAVEAGTVPELMRTRPALPGACHTLPSGTVHALGAGVLVAEVQTPSDTTYRIYDWTREYDRPRRELHIEQAIACADFGDPPAPVACEGDRSAAARTDSYTIDSVRASCKAVDLAADNTGPLVVMLPRTMGASVSSRSGRFDEVTLGAGRTCLIPACLADDAVLRCGPATEAIIARPL